MRDSLLLLLLFFLSLVFHCLFLCVCLLRPKIVTCALDMLLIKATYLLIVAFTTAQRCSGVSMILALDTKLQTYLLTYLG